MAKRNEPNDKKTGPITPEERNSILAAPFAGQMGESENPGHDPQAETESAAQVGAPMVPGLIQLPMWQLRILAAAALLAGENSRTGFLNEEDHQLALERADRLITRHLRDFPGGEGGAK